MDAYGRRAYAECLELAVAARDRFPQHRARTTYWIACIRSLTGEPDLAIEELEATAKLYLLLQGHATRPLEAAEKARLGIWSREGLNLSRYWTYESDIVYELPLDT